MDKFVNQVNVQRENYNIEDKFSCKKIKYKDKSISTDKYQIIDLTDFIFGVQSVKVNDKSYYPNNLGEVDIGEVATLSDITLVNETINSINSQLLQKIVEEQNARIQSDKKINVSQSLTEGYITFTNSDGNKIDIWVGSSGSGGGTDYNNLANKPSINGKELIGNKNGNDLELANLSDLETKQDKLESGINIKTINNQSLLDFGNLELQNKLESGLNIKTINGKSILGSGNIDIQGGGSGGTSNYNELSNKPKIDGVELVGNKTPSQLNLASKTELNNKQDKLVSSTNIKTINGESILGSGNLEIGGGSGTSNYNSLYNKPLINGTELHGNKSSSDLNLETRAIEITKEEYKLLQERGQLKQDVDYYVTDDFTQGYLYVQTVNGVGVDKNSNVTLKTSNIENDSGYIAEDEIGETFATKENLTQEITNRENEDNDLRKELTSLNQLLSTIQSRINELNALIPNQASEENQLADKEFVNSSISTNTSNFIGTFNTLEELESQSATNNDYAFWKTTDSVGVTVFKRYKYISDDGTWQFEYDLNNSSFTAEQWSTINSGLTSDSIPTKTSQLTNDSNFVNTTQLNGALENYVLNTIYPIGSLYWTEDKTFNPNTAWGGTWVRIKEKFIYSAGDSDTLGTTGGSKKISTANLPSHNHSIGGSTGEAGGHGHRLLVYAGSKSSIDNVYGRSVPASNVGGTNANNAYAWNPTYVGTGSNYIEDASNHSHTLPANTGSTGSGTDYMPPYEMAYCWKRTK